MNIKRSLYLGGTIAAGWSTGMSLIFGMTVISERGIIPFAIWGFFNAFALMFFGYLIFKFPSIFRVADSKYIKWFTVLVKIFSIWIQMSAIYEIGMMAGIPSNIAMAVSFVSGIVFVLIVYRLGLNGSMYTDQFQWYLAYAGVLIFIVLGLKSGGFSAPIWGDAYNVKWAVYTGFLLLSGPLVDLQNWQRAKIVYREKLTLAYPFAFLLFLFYMILVLFAGMFEVTHIMSVFIFVVCFLNGTSTLDSDAVALHSIKGAKFGVVIGILTVLTWQLVKSIGFFDLWQIIANLRFYFALAIVIGAIYLTRKEMETGK